MPSGTGIQREYTDAQKQKAYSVWRKLGSLKRTAEQLGIPEGTMVTWSRAQGWVAMRQKDDARDREVVIHNARMRLVDEADLLVDRLIELTRSAESGDRTKLSAIVEAMDRVGLSKGATGDNLKISPREAQTNALSSGERDKLAGFLMNIFAPEKFIAEGSPLDPGVFDDYSREGHSDRADEGLGERGTEREQGGEQNSPHPLAHWITGDLPGRAGPKQESREGDEGTGNES